MCSAGTSAEPKIRDTNINDIPYLYSGSFSVVSKPNSIQHEQKVRGRLVFTIGHAMPEDARQAVLWEQEDFGDLAVCDFFFCEFGAVYKNKEGKSNRFQSL